MPSFPSQVKIVEVGPRDGLQNEPGLVDIQTKLEFIDRLSHTGLKTIEATSLVSPKSIPQLADADEVLKRIHRTKGVCYPVLVPNLHGLERALSLGVKEIAVFTAASETFNRKNIRCGIEESLERYAPVLDQAKSTGISVRGYISCAMGCPYEGQVDPARVAAIAARLHQMGCDEIALGDTIGIGTPLRAQTVLQATAALVPMDCLALHFHDTRGQALAIIFACLEFGASTIDASVAGLGGCPYAPGATGNVATEDVVYMLQGMGIDTGVDLDALIAVGDFICDRLGRVNQSRVATAGCGVTRPTNHTTTTPAHGDT